MLLKEYQRYVQWCKRIGSRPIGFVNWKARRVGCIYDEKKDKLIKIK